MVHAVQDCHGLDPAQHEFEAVRMENVYRRARGLCQRTRYGDLPLPADMRVQCEPGQCTCVRGGSGQGVAQAAMPDGAASTSGDTSR
jgi:hypothetical protein